MIFKITKIKDNYFIKNTELNKTLKTAYSSYESAKAALDYRLFATSLHSDKDYSKKLRDCINTANGIFEHNPVEMQQSEQEFELDSLCETFGIDEKLKI